MKNAAMAPDPTPPESAATPGLEDMGERELLDAATARRRVRRLAEVDELLLAAHWAAVHGEARGQRDPMVEPGGDGTPSLREYALAELAMAQDTHFLTTRAMVADVLDLLHRLPRVWAHVLTGACEPWVARKVAVASRTLSLEQVAIVDRAVARIITSHAPSTVLQVAQAKVIEADPETHRMERERARHERYVRLSRADEFGFRHVIARVTAGDAAWIDAMVDRVADILADTHGEDHNRDELRSLAMGWLARPADLLKLLLDHTEAPSETRGGTSADTEGADGADGDPAAAAGRPAWAPDHLVRTVERLADLSTRQLASLRGRGTLFVHVTDEGLRHHAGLARVEGMGAMCVEDLSELLGHADVRVVPVVDLADRRRVDAYEHPERIEDQAWLLAGGDVFPFSPRTATRDGVDFDHATPYDPHGPPGQTGAHNTGPLRRRHHRWKTFGGYSCRQSGPGRYLWRTPNGLGVLVDDRGSHRLTPTQTELMATAPDGLEIYFRDVVLADDYAA
jgi:hypothetical protein